MKCPRGAMVYAKKWQQRLNYLFIGTMHQKHWLKHEWTEKETDSLQNPQASVRRRMFQNHQWQQTAVCNSSQKINTLTDLHMETALLIYTEQAKGKQVRQDTSEQLRNWITGGNDTAVIEVWLHSLTWVSLKQSWDVHFGKVPVLRILF